MNIDLRSDILSPMSSTVAQAFVAAASGRPAFGLDEDPDERALCADVARLFGFEASLIVPTGTMANQIAIRLTCSPGEGLLADVSSHIASNERQSTVGLCGVRPVVLEGLLGHPSAAQIEAGLASPPANRAARRVRLVCLENTNNRAGGTVLPLDALAGIADVVARQAVSLHIDGARLWHAAVALDLADDRLPSLARGAATLSLNLNKALGAPLGSLLLGSREMVREAHAVRRMMGGWWRPLGPVAAAARASLAGFRTRLAADHAHARLFAVRLAEAGVSVDLPETNIVMVKTERSEEAARALASRGVHATTYDGERLRFVFHAGISTADAVRAAQVVALIAKSRSSYSG